MLTQKKSYSFDKTYTDSPLKKQAVRGGSVTLFNRFCDYGVQIICTAIIARILTPSDFGLVAISTAITGFFFIFRNLGLSDATIQRQSITHAQVSTLFWINVAASLIFTIFLIALSPIISWFFKDPRLINIVVISSFSFIAAGFSTQHQALLKRDLRFMAIAINDFISIIISFSVSLIMAIKGFGYWALVIRPLVLSFSLCAGYWLLCPWTPSKPLRRTGIRPMLKFGVNIIAYYVVDYFSKNLDKTLIGWKYGTTQLGYYSKAFQLFWAPVNQLTVPLSGVAVSTLSKLQNEPSRYHSYYLKAIQFIAFCGFPLSIFLTVNSTSLILILLGNQWIQAAGIFSILGFSAGIQLIVSTRAWLFVSLGRTDRWFYTGIVSAIVMVFFIIAGLRFGTTGVAIAYSAFVYLSLVPSLWYAGEPIGISFADIFKVLWKPFVSSLLAGIINLIVMERYFYNITPVIKILISLLFFLCFYCGLMVLFHGSMKPFTDFFRLLKLIFPGIRNNKAEI